MNSYVVVFPSPFARSKSALLASNVKKILKVKELAYDSIRRDGQIIIVDAKDPVFASSAIGLLYGIERVAIAKKVGNGFDETVKEMAKVGSSLLLREDKFFIKVGGVPLGTTVADLELAATSAIIESSSESGALPGTANDHNRLLYTHVTKNGSYVCIFIDEGLPHEIFSKYDDLLIEPIFFPPFFYCKKCLTFTSPNACPHDADARVQISGTKLREMLQAGQSPSEYVLRPEVSKVIMDYKKPFVNRQSPLRYFAYSMRGLATFQRTRKQHKLTKTLNEVGKNHVCNLIDKIQKEKIRAYARI